MVKVKCTGLFAKITQPITAGEVWKWGPIPLEDRERTPLNLIQRGIEEKLIPQEPESFTPSKFGANLQQFSKDREEQAQLYSEYDVDPI